LTSSDDDDDDDDDDCHGSSPRHGPAPLLVKTSRPADAECGCRVRQVLVLFSDNWDYQDMPRFVKNEVAATCQPLS
jgi:hypothetical protein